ncbi:cell division protein ZapC domain-containing protein [Psychromonas hadalis]|uniref:cell division protein ZapC domain-containing protein n=1 Tax=Psychromonas hadalis TaxID=211669 RepID=UPI0003B40EE9|nr:cell division protein ZapC domain-containing protein [Psychromonas hadalis]
MDFSPKSNWQWVFDKQRALLTLQMGDYLIDISYKSNMLVLPDDKPIPFTVDDVARYMQLFESLAFKEYEAAFSCNIILHILAIELFHKPIMPKSWLFTNNSSPVESALDLMAHVSLTAKSSNESAHYLVLEDEKEFVLCMLMDQVHQLTPRKFLKQFQIIKVTSGKLSLIKTADENNGYSFQIA